ncbi:MAG: hypothetical protein AAF493_15070 [Pseudomonadota bacterium]
MPTSDDDAPAPERSEPTRITFAAMQRFRIALEREGILIDTEQWERALEELEYYDPAIGAKHYHVERAPRVRRPREG